MINRIFLLLFIFVSIFAEKCQNGFPKTFSCRNTAVERKVLEDCHNRSAYIVCQHYFHIQSGEVRKITIKNVEAEVVTDETKKCDHRNMLKLNAFCTKNNCDISEEEILPICKKELFFLWGRNSLQTRDEISCNINLTAPDESKNMLDKWVSSKPTFSKELKKCVAKNRTIDIYCDWDKCDERSNRQLFNKCWPGSEFIPLTHSNYSITEAIKCNNIEYVANINNLDSKELTSTCEVDIQAVNGSLYRSTTFREKKNYTRDECTTDPHQRSFKYWCNEDNCDQINDVAELAAKCNVELNRCGNMTDFRFISDNYAKLCKFVFEIIENGDGTSTIQRAIPPKFSNLNINPPQCKSLNDTHFAVYCRRNCQDMGPSRALEMCYTDETRSRVMNFVCPILLFFITFGVFSGGFIAIRKSNNRLEETQEKYLSEFGVSFKNHTLRNEESDHSKKTKGKTTKTTKTTMTTEMRKRTKSGVTTRKTTNTKKTTVTGHTTKTVKKTLID